MSEHDLSRSNFTVDVASVDLPVLTDHGMKVVAGAGEVRHLPLSVNRELGIERGIWEAAEGVVEDTEVDELAVIVSGDATIEFLDGSAPPVELRPGTMLILKEGVRTRWTVRKRLRKVYQTPWAGD
ncbi:MAG: cupin domain-containing protein [Alphaproteobacteria bacterium]|nr:cupin domain-containing protein [Rhodospirillaceae bacterium]MBT6510027.1 cupin domain-containing protein [Rhodospirillaceae bacterium]MDG2479549.1 cupin domain-containing protein [Alphaproteobacteria bacterium]